MMTLFSRNLTKCSFAFRWEFTKIN